MNRSLTNLRCIVTGASSGIGREIALQLIAAGANVAAVARSAEKLSSLKTESHGPGTLLPVNADITVPADRERIVTTAVQQWGGLDLLVNNAGITSFGHFTESNEEVNRQMLETNFFGPAELTRLCVPHLRKGVTPCVAVTTSMCARRGMPAWSEYSASKFALMALVESWRVEFVRYGIDVVSTVPGLTRTGLHDSMIRNDGKWSIPFDKAMAAKDVAAATLQAIRKNRREVWLGGEAWLVLLANKYAPRLTNRLIGKKVKKLYAVE